MFRVSTAAPPLSHASTNGGLGRPAALAGTLGPGRRSAKSVTELEDTVSCSPRRALRQAAWSTSPGVAPNYGHPAALLARSRWVRRVRRPAGACWRRWWPQRKGGAVWRVKAANRCIGYLRSLMRARPSSPVVRNGGGDPAALVGPCCCCKAQIHLLLCDASCHLPKCGVWVQPIGLRSLRGVHARARPSPRRQRSAENLPFSYSLKWQVRLPAHPALPPDANHQRA